MPLAAERMLCPHTKDMKCTHCRTVLDEKRVVHSVSWPCPKAETRCHLVGQIFCSAPGRSCMLDYQDKIKDSIFGEHVYISPYSGWGSPEDGPFHYRLIADCYEKRASVKWTNVFCAGCGLRELDGGRTFKSCSGCKASRFCSPGCQKEHWPFHKSKCKQLASARLELVEIVASRLTESIPKRFRVF